MAWISGLLVALILLVYEPVRRHEFVNFDDAQYVSGNPMVTAGLSWRGAAWAFTTSHAGNWHPLTWLCHMLDVDLFGLDPGAHHLVNVALHLTNTLLLFGLLLFMTGALGPSAFVAAMFGVHPLHVESVAWVAERKDVLSTCFGFLALWCYAGYVRRPGVARFAALLFLFALALLAKPMWVTLPFVLLLLDAWPLGRLGRGPIRSLVIEKLPLLALSVTSSIVTIVVQRQAGAIRGLEALRLLRRIGNACVAYVVYVIQTLFPADLAPIYPYPAPHPLATLAAGAALLGLSIGAWRARQRKPYLFVGWAWYLGTLVPVIGLVQVGSQPWADRYTYLPMVGLLIILAWGIPEMLRTWRHRDVALTASAALAIVASAFASHTQVQHWRTSVALWQHALAVTTDNARAQHNLAHAFALQGRAGEAVPHYLEALRLNPGSAETHNNLGHAYAELGEQDEAIPHYVEAIRLQPDYAAPHKNLGRALASQGKTSEAIPHYREGLRWDPDDAGTLNALGVALAKEGKPEEAIDRYRAAARLDPDFVDARANLGRALAGQGRAEEALRELREALRLRPNEADFHYDVAVLLHRTGQSRDAIRELEAAIALDPNHEPARQALLALRNAMPDAARK